MRNIIVVCLLFLGFSLSAQTTSAGSAKRILILLDGSGSMLDPWKGTNKWEVAKKLVVKTIDSIQKEDPEVEIGIRVFGHQSPRAAHDCKDSKLEVSISKNSGYNVKNALNNIVPKGYTPIAYSLFLSAGDFISTEGTNSIILITDGIENCEGDPCASSQALRDKKITLKPFVIGLGLAETDKKQFDCIGSYYDAGDEKSFSNAMSIVVSQALNITTTQINLLDAFGLPVEKNIEITLYDHATGEVRYNYVHTPDSRNQPDTLFLYPIGKYDIVVHTFPIVTLNDIELTPGKHNIIGIDVPLGNLIISEGQSTSFSPKQCVVRDNKTGEIVYAQNFNTKERYIAGVYDIDILTVPRLHYEDFVIKGGVDNKIDIPLPGTLNISTTENKVYSIYLVKEGKLEKVYESSLNANNEMVQLLPGDYKIFSRSNIKKYSANTKDIAVTIKSAKTTIIKI